MSRQNLSTLYQVCSLIAHAKSMHKNALAKLMKVTQKIIPAQEIVAIITQLHKDGKLAYNGTLYNHVQQTTDAHTNMHHAIISRQLLGMWSSFNLKRGSTRCIPCCGYVLLLPRESSLSSSRQRSTTRLPSLSLKTCTISLAPLDSL